MSARMLGETTSGATGVRTTGTVGVEATLTVDGVLGALATVATDGTDGALGALTMVAVVGVVAAGGDVTTTGTADTPFTLNEPETTLMKLESTGPALPLTVTFCKDPPPAADTRSGPVETLTAVVPARIRFPADR